MVTVAVEDGVMVAVSVIVQETVMVEVSVIDGVSVVVGVVVDVFSIIWVEVVVTVAVEEMVAVNVSPGVAVSVIVCVKTGTSGVSTGVVGDCFLQEIMNTDSKQITNSNFFINSPFFNLFFSRYNKLKREICQR
jgi:hypothetical protein